MRLDMLPSRQTHQTNMKASKPISCSLIGLACVLLHAQSPPLGEAAQGRGPVPEGFCTKLQTLFEKHYPGVAFTNSQFNGVHIEHKVTWIESAPADTTKKHENSRSRGPEKGGVLCSIYLQKGEYRGQLALRSRGGGQYESYVMDKKTYKQLLMAPYSNRRDVHLWVSLKYPADASDDFLKEFRALMKDFEKDAP